MSTDSETPPSSRTIKASEFKAKCLKLMDEVAESGEEIIITKNGRPVAKLTPYREVPEFTFGRYRDKIHIHGDIVSPMPPEWFAVHDEYADADPLIAPIPPDWSSGPVDSSEEIS